MTKKRRIILAVAVIILLLIIFMNFSLSTSTSSNKVWNEPDFAWNSQIDEKLDGLLVNKSIDFSKEKFSKQVKKTISDSTVIESNVNVEFDKKLTIKYIFENLDISLARYIPIYKPISYKTEVYYKWTAEINGLKIDTTLTGHGKMRIEGDNNIFGIYSSSKAYNDILKAIRVPVKKGINTEIDKKIQELF